MRALLEDIMSALTAGKKLDDAALERLIRRHNKNLGPDKKQYSKRRLSAFYQKQRACGTELYRTWHISPELDRLIVSTLRCKPRRSASGTVSITVLTRPQGCSNACLYCPCDLRMPKSYMHNEPACQRAEQCYFDPFLQLSCRLDALISMGHRVDKVELIIIGATWTDYPRDYQIWFIRELLRALNLGANERAERARERRSLYEQAGLSCESDACAGAVSQVQKRVYAGEISFNEGIDELYGAHSLWEALFRQQRASLSSLVSEQISNESSEHRVMGLSIETRPDTINVSELQFLRLCGCNRVQIGIQSLDEAILAANNRAMSRATIENAFALLRLFGFRIQTHLMVNLYTSTPEYDMADYLELVHCDALKPDELKIYPCVLVEGTPLNRLYEEGLWQPYSQEILRLIMQADLRATPAFVRISRMIRDIAVKDILAGNKCSNLRQLVEEELADDERLEEIRFREPKGGDIAADTFIFKDYSYKTTVSHEHFLQILTPTDTILAFLRLSMPFTCAIEKIGDMSLRAFEAMIRELHVYGPAARRNNSCVDYSSTDLAKELLERAQQIAKTYGYHSLKILSCPGIKEFFSSYGFVSDDAYLRFAL